MAIVKNAVKAMESTMPKEQIRRARSVAEREILSVRLAELRGTTVERVAALTGANARRLFHLSDETLGEGG